MYEGYLKIGGIEILNRARASAYLREHLAGRVSVKCDDAAMRVALGHGAYTTPARDKAAWYTGRRVTGSRFLGLYPGKLTGAEDSTRTVELTELSGDGAVMTSPRYGALEMRFTASAFALDDAAMEEGLAWLREVLAGDGCSDGDFGCVGREAQLFSAMPTTLIEGNRYTRILHRVETTEGPRVIRKYPVRGFTMWQIEFTLTAGIAWPFTALADAGHLNLDLASNFQDPTGEDCSIIADAYDSFVDDPFFTGIIRPPRPAAILPPNILKITSWRRLSLNIPVAQTQTWGRVVPVVNVSTIKDVQYLRLRFYKDGNAGCAFAGEFIVSYMPAGSTLKLDGVKREATIRLKTGKVVPAGNLLFGSNGRPFMWPTLGCQHAYKMTADLMPGQTGVVVFLQTAVRS